MSKVENAVQWALARANDPKSGYDQINRWGPDYDCSSLIISAFEQAGIKVKSAGATYTGNMREAFKKCGFVEVKIGDRKRGDVLLNVQHHTALCLDHDNIVHAAINEKGTTTGGKTGDQTGGEITTRKYYSRPWNYCLRYVEAPDQETRTLKKGDKGEDVKELQKNLNTIIGAGLDVDGSFGGKTESAVKNFQSKNGLAVDGHFGPKSRAKMDELLKNGCSCRYQVTTQSGALNIRAKASMDSAVLGTLAKGTNINISSVQGDWAKLADRDGYVSAKYITKV